MTKGYSYTVLDRFLRYVKIDTQSDPSSTTVPSTAKQKNLGVLLVQELKEMGISNAHIDDFGYVYATLPANTIKKVPVICFCSHMDTSPDFTGTNVKPIVHKKYDGRDLVLPGDATRVIKMSEHPELKNQTGNDIVTSDGTTLLGADNKAGVAEIMDAVHYLLNNAEVKHGDIRILFTPDEEIGRGVDKADMKKLGADFGYTVDGETLGHIENETFSADGMVITILGNPTHPGFAKGKMENALKIAGEILAAIPNEMAPEHTEGKQGFVHPVGVTGSMEKTEIRFIIRDFRTSELAKLENNLKEITNQVLKKYPLSQAEFSVQEQYRNMKEVLNTCPHVAEYAVEAVKRAGLKPVLGSIRGGTDGSRLSFMGLPCPNIFAGEHAFHSPLEWVSVQDMHRAVDTLIHLAMIWEEKSN
ncbi:MAG: peptidase T [Flavobacteriales bacterium]